MSWKHFFLPHPETHQKAHLLSVKALTVYVLIFILIQAGLGLLPKYKPGVLGIISEVDQRELIRLTNEQRTKKGLGELKENPLLNKAAEEKAKNMFEENYWAHYSPSGKDPWQFINEAGYKFSYAGENLARNFYKSNDVVEAWMDSPTHRDNLLNSHYQEIGIAVVEGVLSGQRTTLVVQEFGAPVEAVAAIKPEVVLKPEIAAANVQTLPASTVMVQNQKLNNFFSIDSNFIFKVLGVGLISFLFSLLLLDLYILRRRMVVRLSSRHLPHMAILGVAAGVLLNVSPGSIL